MCDYHDSCYSRLYKSACEIEEDQEIQGLEQLHQVLNLVSQAKEKKKPNKTLQPILSLLKIPLFISFEHWRLSGYHFHLGLSWRQLPLYTFESLNAGSREKPRESSLEAESSQSNLRPTALSAMHVEKMAMQGTDCWASSDSALKARHYHPTSTVSIFFPMVLKRIPVDIHQPGQETWQLTEPSSIKSWSWTPPAYTCYTLRCSKKHLWGSVRQYSDIQ